MKKTFVPNDFRDFLSLISLAGFLGIFLAFSLNINWLQENMTAIFLLVGGLSFLVIGKVFAFKRWVKDGINQNELSQLLAIVIGLSAFIISILLFLEISIPERFLGYIGLIALVPALYTIIDYVAKNKK